MHNLAGLRSHAKNKFTELARRMARDMVAMIGRNRRRCRTMLRVQVNEERPRWGENVMPKRKVILAWALKTPQGTFPRLAALSIGRRELCTNF